MGAGVIPFQAVSENTFEKSRERKDLCRRARLRPTDLERMVAWLTAVVRQTPTGHTPSTGRTLPRSAFPGQEPPRRPPRPPTPVVHRSGLLTTAAYKRPPTSVRRPSPPEHGRPAWSGSTSARQQRNISVSIDRPTSAPSKRKPLKSTAPRAEELEGSHASPRVGGQTGSNQSEASVSRQSSRHSSIAPSAAPSPAPMPTRLPPLSIEGGESKATVEGATFLTAVEEAPAALPAEPTAAASPRDSPRHAPAIGTDFEGAIAARSAEPATIGMMKLHQAKVVRQRAARAVQPARTERAVRAERPAKVRGAHCHPPLRTELPPWKVSWPPKVMAAADKFDRSHCKHWDTAEKAYFELGRDETHIARLELFSHAMLELRRGRYCEPVELGTIQTFAMRAGKEKARKPWKLEESIWGEPTPNAMPQVPRTLTPCVFVRARVRVCSATPQVGGQRVVLGHGEGGAAHVRQRLGTLLVVWHWPAGTAPRRRG